MVKSLKVENVNKHVKKHFEKYFITNRRGGLHCYKDLLLLENEKNNIDHGYEGPNDFCERRVDDEEETVRS